MTIRSALYDVKGYLRSAPYAILPVMAKKKNPAAVALGRKGGKARWSKVTKAERTEIARKVIAARWAKRADPGHG